jgi:microcystin-dependent protein
MVARLLGDPTYFPIEFRRWLKDFLDNADFQISSSQIIGGGAGGASANPTLLPAGIIMPYATTFIGKDCLLCNGNKVSRTDYKELFDAIGTAWGAGDGSTTFTLPDLRDRALYGVGTVISIAQTDGKSLGNRGGPSHYHAFSANTNQAGQHSHSFNAMQPTYEEYYGSYAPTFQRSQQAQQNTNQAGQHQHSVSGVTSGGYDADKPSFAGVQYAITTGRSGS